MVEKYGPFKPDSKHDPIMSLPSLAPYQTTSHLIADVVCRTFVRDASSSREPVHAATAWDEPDEEAEI